MPTWATAVVVLSGPAGSDRLIDILQLGVTGWLAVWHLLDMTHAAIFTDKIAFFYSLPYLKSFDLIDITDSLHLFCALCANQYSLSFKAFGASYLNNSHHQSPIKLKVNQ